MHHPGIEPESLDPQSNALPNELTGWFKNVSAENIIVYTVLDSYFA